MGRTFKSQTVENCFQEILDGVKMRAAALALVALPSALGANSSCAPPWAATCAIVDAFGAATQLVDFAVSVSIDADGATGARVFTRELGATTMQTVMNVASSSKWPSTVTVLRAAARGELDLDAPLAAAIPWWPRDARRDARARTTARDALRFCSGYSCGALCVGGDVCPDPSASSVPDCWRAVFDAQNATYPPGDDWEYNSLHLNLAAAAAELAQPPGPRAPATTARLLQDTLDALGMASSTYCPAGLDGCVPTLAADLDT